MEDIRKFLDKYKVKITVLGLVILGFIFRINGIWLNYSFWTDEASTARFARGVLEIGLPKIATTGYMENSYFITHYLTALSFKIFGINEFSARLPEVIFGTFLILVIYLVGEKIFGKEVGLGAAFLMAFSYIEIAWSRQARGYVILEFFYLLSILFVYLFFSREKLRYFFYFLLSSLIGVWTHTLGLIIYPVFMVYAPFHKNFVRKMFSGKFFIFGVIILVFILLLLTNLYPTLKIIWRDKISNFKLTMGFIPYYHSLFWRQYTLITFLGVLGLIVLFLQKKREIALLFLAFLITYLFCVSFLVGVPFEKYALPVFPILFLLTSYSLYLISQKFIGRREKSFWFFLFLILFIVGNGNKFSLKPKNFYTLNFDMREIPEIDYKGIYESIKKIAGEQIDSVAIVDISHDMPAWYLGEGKKLFIPRKDVSSEKRVNINSGAVFIHDLEEFKEVTKIYPQGFVVLIEHNFRFYPDGFVEYVRKNLRFEEKEEAAWFSPDWNKWPAEVYSWGFE
ncbi:MAG: ArnT family glycosyltransferase [Microgenomates group bacterium]